MIARTQHNSKEETWPTVRPHDTTEIIEMLMWRHVFLRQEERGRRALSAQGA